MTRERLAALLPNPRCRLHGQPREGEWSCSCGEETEFESAEQHIVRMALAAGVRLDGDESRLREALAEADREVSFVHDIVHMPGRVAEGGLPDIDAAIWRVHDILRAALAATPSDAREEDDEVDPVLRAYFSDRASAIRDVAAHRASPPEYPGLALVPVYLLDRLAQYVELPRTREGFASDARERPVSLGAGPLGLQRARQFLVDQTCEADEGTYICDVHGGTWPAGEHDCDGRIALRRAARAATTPEPTPEAGP